MLRCAASRFARSILAAPLAGGRRLGWLIGGEDRLRLVVSMKSYAEMADPDPSIRKVLAKSLGSEDTAGATLKQFSSSFEGVDYTVFAYRPDLSTQPRRAV